MDRYQNDVGVLVPKVMLPDKDADFYKWAVVACDQFTSQPDAVRQRDEYEPHKRGAAELLRPGQRRVKEKRRTRKTRRIRRGYEDRTNKRRSVYRDSRKVSL